MLLTMRHCYLFSPVFVGNKLADFVLHSVIARLTTLLVVSGIWAWSSIPLHKPVRCVPSDETGGPVITADWVDPDYALYVFDSETDIKNPTPHRRISGHFVGTKVDFNIYLTPKPRWKGRFFQHMHPLQTSLADDKTILFGAESGGYTVQASGTIGYRADAALARLSRRLAREYYNSPSEQIYGYIYGGSGGSLQVVGAAENTFGVWDGCVTLIQAIPMSIPYNWGIRALGGLILANHSKDLIDTIQPGGSGNPHAVLNDLESQILSETQHLGVPIRGWEDWDAIVGNRTQLWKTLKDLTIPILQRMDPTYVDDFWTKHGYAGSDQSALGERFRDALVQFTSPIEKAIAGDDGLVNEFTMGNVPENITDVVGFGFSVIVDNTIQYFSGEFDSATRTVYVSARTSTEIREALRPGIKIQVDNRWYLATHTYHRHQLPPPSSTFQGHDYLRNEQGEPLYPQRNILIGPHISKSASGNGTHTGNITMKMIAMDNLLDIDAFPLHADWYKNQVLKAKGDLQDHYRLYYSDNANHAMGSIEAPYTSRVVDFTGLYQQHLRDMVAWVENNVDPPPPTEYSIEKGQIKIPSSAESRKGIQPVVELFVDESKVTRGTPGKKQEFRVKAQVPDGLGYVVALEWDPLGVGEYTKLDVQPGPEIAFKTSHTYDEPGVYFAGVRAASHRNMKTETDIALAWNLDRVRVVIE
jgi:hypothetical protein